LKKWYEYPLKFSSSRTFFIYDYKILMKCPKTHILKWHLFKWKAFYMKDTYWFSTMVIIHRQEDIILAPITKCYVQTYWLKFSSFRTFFIYDYKILLKISEMSLNAYFRPWLNENHFQFLYANKFISLLFFKNLVYVSYLQDPN
jgi:hypothetical protein